MSPDNDLALPARFRASLQKSQERRVAAMRRRRRRIRGRTLVIAAITCMTAVSGVAVAATTSSTGAQTSQRSATLTVGSSGTAVKQLQRKLGVQVTGYYGPQTKRAVKHFQRAHRLAADGVAGPAT